MSGGIFPAAVITALIASCAYCRYIGHDSANRIKNKPADSRLQSLIPDIQGEGRYDSERGKTGYVSHLTGTIFNFGHMCKGHVIRHGSKILNKDGLTFTSREAKEMMGYLHEMSLPDRMLTWAYQCQMERLERGNSAKQVVVDIKNIDYFEGDIILNPEQMRQVYLQAAVDHTNAEIIVDPESNSNTTREEVSRVRRKVLDLFTYEWNWRVPIKWSMRNPSIYTIGKQMNIRQAFKNWAANTCLRFEEVKKCCAPPPSIVIIRSNGCGANVGKSLPYTYMTLHPTCASSLGTLEHELGHTLGLWHEQSRPDRDLYVRVIRQNIASVFLGNFNRKPWINTATLGLPYDFDSVMHYGRRYFLKRGARGDTLTTRDPDYIRTIGQRYGASFFDIKSINLKYCSAACPGYNSLEWSRCKNHGYRDPVRCNQCRCQKGWAPPFCEQPVRNVRECGSSIYQASTTPQIVRTPIMRWRHNCIWIFKVDRGRVKLTFGPRWRILCRTRCIHYVEIRTESLGIVGPRLCCTDVANRVVYSVGTRVMVIVKLINTNGARYQIQYQKVNCGGSGGRIRYDTPCRVPNERVVPQMMTVYCRFGRFYRRCRKVRKIFRVTRSNFCYPGYTLRAGRCARDAVLETTTTRKPTTTTRKPTTTTRKPTTTTRKPTTTTRKPTTTTRKPTTTTRKPTTTTRKPTTTTRKPTTTTRKPTTTTRKPTTTTRKPTTTTRKPTTTTRKPTTTTRKPTTTTRKPTTTTRKPTTTTRKLTTTRPRQKARCGGCNTRRRGAIACYYHKTVTERVCSLRYKQWCIRYRYTKKRMMFKYCCKGFRLIGNTLLCIKFV